MLLAEALYERAAAQRRFVDLKQRIAENARVQEGEQPAEDPYALLGQAVEVNQRIRDLIVAINVANTMITLPDGDTLAAALAQREALTQRLQLVSDTADRAARRRARSGRAEIREIAVVDVGALRAEADRLAAEHRALDATLHWVNWTTELSPST